MQNPHEENPQVQRMGPLKFMRPTRERGKGRRYEQRNEIFKNVKISWELKRLGIHMGGDGGGEAAKGDRP